MPADYWTKWDVWAHKYNLLGLLSYYSVTGYKPALEASIKMGDLLCKTFGEKEGQRNIIENIYHAGMNNTSVLEPMKYLYRFTGDQKYLDFCNYIVKAFDYEKGQGIPGQYLNIEQSWGKNSVIKVSFDLTIQKLDCGLSYPGYVAIKYGTQVLAVDQALNTEIRDLDQL